MKKQDHPLSLQDLEIESCANTLKEDSLSKPEDPENPKQELFSSEVRLSDSNSSQSSCANLAEDESSESLSKKVSFLNQKHLKSKEAIKDLNQKLRGLKEELSGSAKKVALTESRLEVQSDQVDILRGSLLIKEEEIQDLKNTIKELEEKVRYFEAKAAQDNAFLKESMSELVDKKSLLEELRISSSKYQSRIEGQTNLISGLKIIKKKLEAKNLGAAKEIASMAAEISSYKEEIAKTAKVSNSSKSYAIVLINELAAVSNYMEQIKSTLISDLKVAEDGKQKIKQENSFLKSENEKKAREIESLKADITKLEDEKPLARIKKCFLTNSAKEPRIDVSWRRGLDQNLPQKQRCCIIS